VISLLKFSRNKFIEWAIGNIQGVLIQWGIVTIFGIWSIAGGIDITFLAQLWSHISEFMDIIWFIDTGMTTIALIIHILPRRFFDNYLPNKFN
jgi:hypothetical protein